MSSEDFEMYVRNITCYKTKELPKYFVIKTDDSHTDESVDNYAKYVIEANESKLKWDWIRDKRSIANEDDTSSIDNKGINSNNLSPQRSDYYDSISDENFEKFNRGPYGIYKITNRRRKRKITKERLAQLRNLLPLQPTSNEIYAMLGDNVTIQYNHISTCYNPHDLYVWRRDYGNVQSTVLMHGPSISIKNVQAKDIGNYVCYEGNKILRNITLRLFALPSFRITFVPVYSADADCAYIDLKSMRSLGPVMAEWVCSGSRHCTVGLDGAVCANNKVAGTSEVSATAAVAALSTAARGAACSVACRRDLHCSMAALAAANAAAVGSLTVVLSNGLENITLEPPPRNELEAHTAPVTRTINSKGIRHKNKRLAPGIVDIAASCPTGFYFLRRRMICVVVPATRWPAEGDNKHALDRPPVRGNQGVRYRRPRRYDWWWYPACGSGAAACALLALRAARPRRGASQHIAGVNITSSPRVVTSRQVSPSRVILARLFNRSASFQLTDSQETKFEVWREKRPPPPLPPIDFD